MFALGLTVISNVFYHVIQKSIPAQANPFASIIVSYIVALLVSILVYPLFAGKGTLLDSFKSLNWTSVVLGIVIVGIELGYLFAYRYGGDLNKIPILVTTTVTLLVIPIGFFLFKEQSTWIKALGIVLGIGSIVLLNSK